MAQRIARLDRAISPDLDQQAVEVCREYLPSWHRGGFADPRAHVIYSDGRAFVDNDTSKYDVVIIDVVDMLVNGPVLRLYTRQFYHALRQRLRPNAIVMVQGLEFSFYDYKQHCAMVRTLRFLVTGGIILASDWVKPERISAATFDLLI